MVYTVELLSLQRSPAKGIERLEWQIPGEPPTLCYLDAQAERVRYFDPETKKLKEPDWALRSDELALAQMPKMFQEPEAFRDLRQAQSTRVFSMSALDQRCACLRR